jgi:hypothetical protein
MIDLIFPHSYIAIWLGVFIGIGIAATYVGFFSGAVLTICIILGIIRIRPLFTFADKVIQGGFPELYPRVKKNIKESFKASGNITLEEGRYIFMWHPHALFPTSIYFHTATELTDWPAHLKSRGVVFSSLQWLPFVKEVFDELNIIPTEYHIMKETLKKESISLLPGGMREMLYEDTSLLSRRRGIFKIALETGTPLVPVIARGETELYKAIKLPDYIQNFMGLFDTAMPIPTFKSFMKFLGILQYPLKDPIFSVIGEPILVEKVEVPTEQQISELREKYCEALKSMYKKELGRDLKIL